MKILLWWILVPWKYQNPLTLRIPLERMHWTILSKVSLMCNPIAHLSLKMMQKVSSWNALAVHIIQHTSPKIMTQVPTKTWQAVIKNFNLKIAIELHFARVFHVANISLSIKHKWWGQPHGGTLKVKVAESKRSSSKTYLTDRQVSPVLV